MPFCLVLSKCLRIQIDNLVHEWLIFAILNANFLGTHSNKISGVNFHSIKWPKANLFDTWLTYNVNQNQIRWPYIKGGFWSDFYDILLQQYSTYNLVPLEHYKFKSVWVLTPSSKLSMECELREAYNFSKYIYVAPSKNAGRKLFCFF